MNDTKYFPSPAFTLGADSTDRGAHGAPSTPSDAPATSKPHFTDVTRFHRTDAGNAELFAALFGDKVRYDHLGQRWLKWKEDWWETDTDNTVLLLAKAAARWRATAALARDPEPGEDQYKWAIKSEARYRLESMLKLAQAEHPIADAGTNWDADPMLLGVKNGVVDLRTATYRRGKQSDYVTLHTDVAFDSRARCPRWERFLDEIFPGDRELITFIQRAVGYCLTGDVSEQVLFMCYGTGANGKSTFLDVLRDVLGPYSYNLPFSAFELKSRSSIPNEIAALKARRFVTAIETNEAVELNEARIKALTGSDPITARFLYREFFTFSASGKFWLAFNHKPRVVDDSFGFWRRVRLVPFDRQFSEEKRDPDLLDKLKAEAPGILAWAVRGCLDWQHFGLGVPKVVYEASQAYREESDPLQGFLDDRCVLGTSFSVTSSELWKEYRDWSEVTGERLLDRKSLARRLRARGLHSKQVGHDKTWTWFGVGLKTRSSPASSTGVRADAGVEAPLLPN